jgi:undecaprenyl-diphosphatase
MAKKSQLLLLEITIISLLIGGCAFLFLQLHKGISNKEFLSIDLQILHSLYDLRSPLLNNIMKGATSLGGGIMIGLGILIVIYLVLKKYRLWGIQLTLILCMSGIINTILKNIFQRPRPQFYPLIIARDFSFPSGHAMNSFVFYMALSYLIYQITKNKKLFILTTIISFFLILLIGVSRVYLGVHNLTDILGGYISGFILLLSVLLIKKTLLLLSIMRNK